MKTAQEYIAEARQELSFLEEKTEKFPITYNQTDENGKEFEYKISTRKDLQGTLIGYEVRINGKWIWNTSDLQHAKTLCKKHAKGKLKNVGI